MMQLGRASGPTPASTAPEVDVEPPEESAETPVELVEAPVPELPDAGPLVRPPHELPSKRPERTSACRSVA
jgi:hypothetical protein